MKRLSKNFVRVAVFSFVMAGGMTSKAALAAIVNFNFDTIITGDTPGGSNIATLVIADSGTDSVSVTLFHNSSSAPGQFITDLWFNLDPYVTVTQFGQAPSNKFAGVLAQSLNSEQNAGLNFDLRQQFPTSNSGGGVNRLKPSESISFSLTGSGLNATDFLSHAIPQGGQRTDVYAMIHLQGLENGGSVKLGAVPEPASLSVLGVGALALIRRRRNRRQA